MCDQETVEHLFYDQRLGKEWGEDEGSEEVVEKRDAIDNELEKKHKIVPKKGNVGLKNLLMRRR